MKGLDNTRQVLYDQLEPCSTVNQFKGSKKYAINWLILCWHIIFLNEVYGAFSESLYANNL